MRVDATAARLRSNKKRDFLSGLFKVAILKKFENIRFGRIQVADGEEVYTFGDPGAKTTVKMQVQSPEFYVLLGSGGLLGAAEAYAGGLWKADDLVMLIRTVFRNKDVMRRLESGWSKLMKPMNAIIHWRRKNSLRGSKQNIIE